MALLTGPIVFLLVLELILRVVGWGYPTHFFVPPEGGPPEVLIENAKFGCRFFPKHLARAPDPIRFTKAKPVGTYRVFVFGESAALGDPEPAYGFSRILRELLESRCPGTHFEVINTAMTAISSHAILRIAGDCVPLNGDVWIVYMGNNEVVGPFGAASVFGPKCPPSLLISAGLGLKATRTGQALDALSQSLLGGHHAAFQEWEGMKMMLHEQVRADAPVLQRVYANFEHNLDDILSDGRRSGAKVIVCSMSSNLKDCPPFAALNRPDLTEARKTEWDRLVATGSEQESHKALAEALESYRRAAEIDNSHAGLAFRTARCSAALGDVAGAHSFYVQARDLDVLRFRADTRINQLVQDVCARHAAEGVTWLNSGALLTNVCKLGIAGGECFWDHVHFNFTGNYLLARGLAEQVLSLLPSAGKVSVSGKVLTEAECAARLAYTDWDRLGVADRMWRREQEPPFVQQIDHEAWLKALSTEREELQKRAGPSGLTNAIQIYQAALERRPKDWVLHHRYGLLLEACGDASGAARQWNRVVELVPQFTDAWFKLGEMASLNSQPGEAADFYRRVLKLRPDSFEAINGLGLIALGQGDYDRSAHLFQQALHLNPKFVQAHINWGLLCSRRGLPADAEAHYREALRCDPESAAGNIDLANLLAGQQKFPEAVDHYRTAIRLRPREATFHLGLANSLAALGRAAESVEEYQEAVHLNPSLAEAQFNLGIAFAKQGDLASATACFEAAARVSPDDPQVHLNLGVALAKQGRFPEAVEQFKAVLRIDPANAPAKQYLETALARSAGRP